MDANGSPHDVEQLLATLEKMPVDALQIVQSFVTELVQHPDDVEHRKETLSGAISKMSALRSV